MDPRSWEMPFVLVWALLFLIVLLRAGATYGLGRAARKGASQSASITRVLEAPRYRRVESLIDRWGAPVVALSFLTVGFQTLANAAAGVTRMRLTRYVPALLIGGAAWALIYSTVGIVSIAAVIAAYERAPVVTLCCAAVLVIALGAFIGIRVRRHGSEESVS